MTTITANNFEADSTSGRAINATCSDPNNDCINGTSSAAAHAGVSANNSGSGIGLFASSAKGAAGLFEGPVNVNSTSGRAINATCSDPNNDCINGTSSAAAHAGVS